MAVLVTTVALAAVIVLVVLALPPLSAPSASTSATPAGTSSNPAWVELDPTGPAGPYVSSVEDPPVPSVMTTVTAPPAGPSGAGFAAVAGAGCVETTSAGSFAAFTAGSPVQTVAGGWSGDGCSGLFWSVPMSRDPSRDDPATRVLWWFNSPTIATGECAVWAYTPRRERDQDVAGTPAYYQVVRGRDDETVIGSFTIDQPSTAGAWVYGGTFPLSSGRIAVILGNRGSGAGGARLAAAQIKAVCAQEGATRR